MIQEQIKWLKGNIGIFEGALSHIEALDLPDGAYMQMHLDIIQGIIDDLDKSVYNYEYPPLDAEEVMWFYFEHIGFKEVV